MSETLTSLGLDVGTTSTQMIFSRLEIENKAGSFSVPEMAIGKREVLYRSPVFFTPLQGTDRVDAMALKKIVDGEYERAGISKAQVDTGAIIITGETARKENARAVLEALADYAGEFVVATAGPDLESVLAAKGAGAVEYSERTGKRVLHMDIGGGTSNLALIESGKITATGCLNVGGRLVKIREDGVLTYVSPVLEGLFPKKAGEAVTRNEIENLAEDLTRVLEMAAGLREEDPKLLLLTTAGTRLIQVPPGTVFSFSGGVADCIGQKKPWLAYGDMGPELGRAIRGSRLCAAKFVLGRETIRATVIGAGSHSTQLSGSTVFCQNVRFPLKNLPVAALTREEQELAGADFSETVHARLKTLDGDGVLALPGVGNGGYWTVAALAEKLLAAMEGRPMYLALEADMAKALGQQLALRLGEGAQVLCLDRIRLEAGSYLDVGAPVGPAVPVVVKTLVIGN